MNEKGIDLSEDIEASHADRSSRVDFEWGGMVFRQRKDEDGGCHMEVEFRVDFDRERPPFWRKLPDQLKSAGFDVISDPLTGDTEFFLPASFHRAEAAIMAKKYYPS